MKVVTHLEVRCFNLQDASYMQESLLETTRERKRKVSKALDTINDTWGEWTIYSVRMYGRSKEIIDRIAFGGVKDLEEIYVQ